MITKFKKYRKKICFTVFTVALLTGLLAIACYAEDPTIGTVSNFSDLIKLMMSSLSDVITGLATGIKTGFLNLLYEDPSASTKVFSSFAVWSFIIMGLTIGLGLCYTIIRFVTQRNRI